MKPGRRTRVLAAGLLTVCALAAAVVLWREPLDFSAAVAAGRQPQVRPDYGDAVIPPNIAPLNFQVDEAAAEYRVRIRSEQGAAIEVASRTGKIVIPRAPWRNLLGANRGRKLYFDVAVRRHGHGWERFEPIQATIADAEIDRYLSYRLIQPIHILWGDIDICQRDLEHYRESTILSNRSFRGGCINCHTFAPHHPDRMIVHSRGSEENPEWSGMTVVRDGQVTKVDTRSLVHDPESDRGLVTQAMATYTAWHPNGRHVAFSVNRITQFFHAVGEARDVFDSASDLALYDADSNRVTTTPEISRPDRLETFPAWSADGRYLYFCSADPLPRDRYDEVRYDLMRIGFDAASGRWGELEEVLSASQTGLSISQPRPSPDGRWILFCMMDYGAFPAFRSSSDLYLLDRERRQYKRLEVNSEQAESWHSWSSNSRWIAFASKRRDGVFARIYLSYVDEAGRAHTPVLVPQKDPSFYDRLLKTYTVPELSRTPAPASSRVLARAIRSPYPAGASPPQREMMMEVLGVP